MKGKALWLQLPRYRKRKPPAARKYIRSATPEQAARQARYRKRVKVWIKLPANRWCPVMRRIFGKRRRARHCHHWAGRQGSLLLYEPYWMAVSYRGHVWIDQNREQARAHGFLCPIGSWNKPPPHPTPNET